ncbi:hypothetical protein C8F04DRAFT_1321412 [Mycena alexandri]|uniref:BHLH domain-containing protein n=1 Tax=Mycena alexandri TaxID=1745969 RepID=A0AAD6WNR8_9AGAR|nr:hypothetical protein C8F04DRAFT_1321412 [Mycena alexandri]
MECGKRTSRSLLPLPPYSRLHPVVAGDELNHRLDQQNLEVALDKDKRTRIYEGGGLISGGTAKDSDEARVLEAPCQINDTRANNYYISHVSGGTGGAGGRGGEDGGVGGVGEGPSFQAETIIFHNTPEDREKIIKWASPLNFFPRQADILSSRQPGTGDWFLQHWMFKKWKAGEIPALWCCGIRAGKTTLVSIVVDDLRANLANQNTGVGVLYLDHKTTAEAHSPKNLLAAIWRQLALEQPISSDFHRLYKKHRAQGTCLSLEETYSMLLSTVSKFSVVFIVVDALDEYLEIHRNTLLRILWKLGAPVRLMLTSRPHINIDHLISNIEILDVQASEEDIRRYLEGQIQESSRLSRHIQKLPTLRELMEEKIVKSSDGMFLLAKLHGTYDDIVNRIRQQSEDDRQLAWRTLSWVLNAKTPLRPLQLREALAVEPGATVLDPDRQTDMDIILSVCAGLVIIDKEDDKVRLIHYTTQMYFQLAHVQSNMFPYAQSKITLTCITYMSLTFKAFTHRLEYPLLLFTHNPFLHYTVEYCLMHARGDPETRIKHSILSFLANCSVWWRLWNWKHGEPQSAPDKHRIAMAFHLEVIARHVINENGAGNLLQEAASQGATDTVRILLQNGVGEENEGGALQVAVIHGHEEIVRLLLAHDVENNSQHHNNTPLKGNRNMESVDLECVAQVLGNAERRNRYGASLYQASWTGNEAIIMLLIQHGADMNVDGGEYGSAVGAATVAGHESVLKLLLEHGADINAKDGDYFRTLQTASWKGHEAIVKLHLKHGVDVNAGGGEYGSALQAASQEGHEAIVKLLLELGANVNAGGGHYGSALQAASKKGHEAVVKLLLELGANINAGGGHYGSALQAASEEGHEAIVKLLFEFGADINAESRVHGSALQAASKEGREAVVKLLLERGADVNARGSRYGSALQAAFTGGHEAVVKLLLERGADVNAESGYDDTALQLAYEENHKAVTKLHIAHGANIEYNLYLHEDDVVYPPVDDSEDLPYPYNMRSRSEDLPHPYNMSLRSDSDDELYRKEAKRRIEAEQRRRDELRESYKKLKDVLPVPNWHKITTVSLLKITKVALLNRGSLRQVTSLSSSRKIKLCGPASRASRRISGGCS